MEAGATDILNVHGQVSDVMRIGWLAAELGIPVTWATPSSSRRPYGLRTARGQWLEYSFQNFDQLVDDPIVIRDGDLSHRTNRGTASFSRNTREVSLLDRI